VSVSVVVVLEAVGPLEEVVVVAVGPLVAV
jgi:hypothetical protein